MRYAEFRDRLEDAFQEAGLFFHDADRRVETIDLADTLRGWKVYVCRAAPRSAEPFHVSAVIGFEWAPSRRLARTPAKKTSSRNSLAEGDDRSGQSGGGRG